MSGEGFSVSRGTLGGNGTEGLLKSERKALEAMFRFQKEVPDLSDQAAACLSAAAATISLSYQVARLAKFVGPSREGPKQNL